MTDEVTTLDIVTLVIATIGALTGIAGLVWAVATHTLTGARVKVDLLVGWVSGGAVVSVPWSKYRPGEPPPFTGFRAEDALVGVQVRNAGRMHCSVNWWGITLDNAVSLTGVELPINRPLPHRLDAGEEVTWFAELHDVAAMVRATEGAKVPSKAIFGQVRLGDGRAVHSKRYGIR